MSSFVSPLFLARSQTISPGTLATYSICLKIEAIYISKNSPLIKNLWLVDNLKIRTAETIILAGAGIFREINSIFTKPLSVWFDFPSVNERTVDATPWIDNHEEKELEN